MDVTIVPSTVAGSTSAPPSKSYTHRALLAGGYADGATIHDALWCGDTLSTRKAIEAFGANVREDETRDASIRVDGFEGEPLVAPDVVDCGNSGTTMRFATATAALVDGTTVLTGDHSLRTRPQGPLLTAIDQLGATAESTHRDGTAPLVVSGPAAGGRTSVPGDVSSQFVSALLFAGASMEEGIEIVLETALKSAPYVDVTVDVLSTFDVEVERTTDGFAVAGGQSFRAPVDGYRVPGDFSSISYLLASGAIAGEPAIEVTGAIAGRQGDVAIIDVLDRMGAEVLWDRSEGTIEVRRSPLSGITVDVGDTPDLLPTIAALGAHASGETRIENAEHVRYKESDRVSAMADGLQRLGVEVTETTDGLIIEGNPGGIAGTAVDGRGDHRVVMALSVAALGANGPTTISGADHVEVSYPQFFDTIETLGVKFDRRD